MFRPLFAVVALGAGSIAPPAWGEGVDFGYSYGAATAEADETEFALWITDRRGKGAGSYDAQDYRLEVERGITNQFTLAGYINLASHHVRRLQPDFADIDNDFDVQGVSAEFKYNLIRPTARRLGLTIYAEPGWSRIGKVSGEKHTEYDVEFKAIVQKNFADERVVWVANLTLEPEWEIKAQQRAAGPDKAEWETELKAEVTSAIAYRLAPRWALGIEGRYSSVYPDWTEGLHRTAYAVSAGPTIHHSFGKWGITATWLPQLFGSPNALGSGFSLDEFESQEVRVKIGYEL